MHQINMRMAVTLLRDAAAEKTKEQTEHEALKDKPVKEKTAPKEAQSVSIWRRKFRALPEEKAVDLFADVIGDSFILFVAGGLILYEYVRAKGKPDVNGEKIAELNKKLEELENRGKELEEAEKVQRDRVETLEQALEVMRQAANKKRFSLVSS
jgi:hypothetical protein